MYCVTQISQQCSHFIFNMVSEQERSRSDLLWPPAVVLRPLSAAAAATSGRCLPSSNFPAKPGLCAPRGARPTPASHVSSSATTRHHSNASFPAREAHVPPSNRRNVTGPPPVTSSASPGYSPALVFLILTTWNVSASCSLLFSLLGFRLFGQK